MSYDDNIWDSATLRYELDSPKFWSTSEAYYFKRFTSQAFLLFFSFERFPKSILVVWPREWHQINPQNIWNKRIEPIFDWRSQNFFWDLQSSLTVSFSHVWMSKMASEISKIHFWGQKIKFSFWLNKCFWNVLQLVKHIQEGYFYIFKVVTHSESYLCRQQKAKKWVKTDLRNFENPFLRSKNQIFFLTQ